MYRYSVVLVVLIFFESGHTNSKPVRYGTESNCHPEILHTVLASCKIVYTNSCTIKFGNVYVLSRICFIAQHRLWSCPKFLIGLLSSLLFDLFSLCSALALALALLCATQRCSVCYARLCSPPDRLRSIRQYKAIWLFLVPDLVYCTLCSITKSWWLFQARCAHWPARWPPGRSWLLALPAACLLHRQGSRNPDPYPDFFQL